MLGFPDAEALDITGPLEVFSEANRLLHAKRLTRAPAYSIEVIGLRAGPFPTTSGVRLVAERAYREVRGADLLLISGGRGCHRVLQDETLLEWIRRVSHGAQRVGAVCTGAFILAQTGLLDGRAATTHWSETADLALDNIPPLPCEPTPSTCAMGNTTPPPALPPESIWRSPWWKKTGAGIPLCRSPVRWSCS